jgi:hypothetical protein
MFGYERRPLGFTVKLVEIRHEPVAGSPDGRPGVSRLSFPPANSPAGAEAIQEVSMQRTLQHGGFTFRHEGFQPMPNGVELSLLQVTSDPGALLRYAGIALVSIGVLLGVGMHRFGRKGKEPPSVTPHVSG